MLIQERQIERLLQPALEIFLRNAAGKLKRGDEFFVVVFSALHR